MRSKGTAVSKADEASIALWLHYRREPERFAELPEAWRHSIAEHYTDARKRRQLRQRRSVLPLSVLAALAAVSATKARAATNYTTPLTGTAADTAYQSGTDANGNLVYRFVDGDSIGITANGAQNVSGIGLQSGTPKVVLQVSGDGKGTLSVSAIRPAADAFGSAHAIDVGAGEDLTVNGNTSAYAQSDDPFRYVNGQWVVGSEGQGLHLDRGTATFNGNLDVNTKTKAWSQGLWIYRGFLTVNGNTNIVTHGPGTNTAGIYNSGGGTGNVLFNGNLGIVSYGDWPNDTVQGIYNDNVNTRLTVNGDLDVAATSNGSTVMGIRNQGTMYVAGNATINVDGPRSALGIYNTHASARFRISGDLKVTVTSHTNYTPFGLPTALGNAYGHTYGFMTLEGAVDARVSGVTDSYAANNNSVMSFTNAAKTAVLRASVNCATCNVYGIANNGGTVTLAGGLDVAVSNTGSGARYAIWNVANDGGWQAVSPLSVNQAGGQSVKVDGDVLTQNVVNAAGSHFTATTQLNFNDDASFLKGMVLGGSGTSGPNGTSTLSAGVPILTFANGARWMPGGSGTLASDFGAGSLSLGNGGTIDLAASWGAFAQGSVPTHSLRSLSVDSSTGGATVNLADGATFTLLSDIRHAQADKVSFGAGIATFNAAGTQKVRIAYDPVLDDTSWVNASALQNGTSIAAAQPVAIVDASAAAGGTAAFKAVAGIAGQWGATYENALVRFNYVPRVQTSGDGKQILLTGIDILGSGAGSSGGTTPPATGGSAGGSASGGSGTTPDTPPSSGTPPIASAPSGTPPTTVPSAPASPGAAAIAPSTGVLVAGDAALALSNLWQIDERAVSRRSEAWRLGEASAGSAFWVDADDGGLRGDGAAGRAYRQHAANTSAGLEWQTDAGQGRSAVGLVYTHAQSRADLQNGRADLRGDSLGLYGTWNADNGLFADAVARAGRLSDRYSASDAFGMSSGRYHARAMSASVRAGRRFAIGRSDYIEPQVQAAYGAIGPVAYTASNGVRVEMGHNRTFQSRAGVLAGHVFTWPADSAGEVYGRVAVVHTVGSRPDITASLDGGSLPLALPARHDTVGEAAVGMRMSFGRAWSAFAEAGRSSRTDVIAGGWRAAAGFRWQF